MDILDGGLVGDLDLSMFTFSSEAFSFNVKRNSLLTNVILPANFSSPLEKFNVSYCKFSGTYDLSKFQSLYGNNSDIDFSYNSNLSEVVFYNSISGKVYNLNLSNCRFQGTLDLSMFNELSDNSQNCSKK